MPQGAETSTALSKGVANGSKAPSDGWSCNPYDILIDAAAGDPVRLLSSTALGF